MMDRKSRSLFDVVAKGDETTLQRLLLDDKEERNIATLAVSLTLIESNWETQCCLFLARQHGAA